MNAFSFSIQLSLRSVVQNVIVRFNNRLVICIEYFSAAEFRRRQVSTGRRWVFLNPTKSWKNIFHIDNFLKDIQLHDFHWFLFNFWTDPEYGSHFEGDMILNQEQLMAATSLGRNGLIHSKYRWPNKTVPYLLNSNHTQKQQDHIELALKTLESISCVKFVRRTDEVDYVELRVSLLR